MMLFSVISFPYYVYILLMSVTYSPDIDIETVAKHWYDVDMIERIVFSPAHAGCVPAEMKSM